MYISALIRVYQKVRVLSSKSSHFSQICTLLRFCLNSVAVDLLKSAPFHTSAYYSINWSMCCRCSLRCGLRCSLQCPLPSLWSGTCCASAPARLIDDAGGSVQDDMRLPSVVRLLSLCALRMPSIGPCPCPCPQSVLRASWGPSRTSCGVGGIGAPV